MDNSSAVLALTALAFETRLETLQLLATAGETGMPAGELARRLNVPQNTLSGHLGALTRAGLLQAERRSQSIIYRSNFATLPMLIAYLEQTCTAPKQELSGTGS